VSDATGRAESSQSIERLARRLERERKARAEAEALLEERSRELYLANENLLLVKQDLEHQVELRTRELQEMLGEATDAVNARSRFMAVMSHEIRTPLNGIIGLAELLSLTTLDAEQQQYVEALVKSGAALRQLIDNVLDLSRLEADRLELEQRPFDLLAELESVASVYRPLTAARGLAFGLDLRAEGGRQVLGDSLRLRQILSNLLSNALKFTPSGGIRLGCNTAREGSGLRARIRVSDTGIGIPADARSRLFESFAQAEASTTRKYGGSGLGLAICRRLAEAMQGHLRLAASEPGAGTTFELDVLFAWEGTA
jgi:hypothetical protein